MKGKDVWLRRLARISLTCVFLVVLAGSVVRMTGSGMGCPDWPRCFGYLIPPTEESQVIWHPNRQYHSGQMIVHQEKLWVANRAFTSSDTFDQDSWNVYDKHDYAIFNAFHTWTEYINRLIGAFTGLPVLLLFVLSLTKWSSDKWIPVLAALTVFMLGFEAWLGKLVVDGNLVPMQITIHMFGAMVLVALLILLIARLRTTSAKFDTPPVLQRILILVVVLTLVQVFLGTAVREEVDVLLKSGTARSNLIESLPMIFKIHRSFSLVLLGLNAWLVYRLWQIPNRSKVMLQLWAGILFTEVIFGIGLAYLDFPASLQPAHLLLGMGLFAVQWHALVSRGNPKTLEIAS